MKKTLLLLIAAASMTLSAQAQKATVNESQIEIKTYPFGDPNPVANPENLFYPYFRFDGFAAEGISKKWTTVVLENDYIRVTLFPEIGGKIWGAEEKSTGNAFIYYNHVVKFRDIAMRGAWVSGGIEFNFGIIGHAPTSATPVDYTTATKPDGSVSCYISANDYITRTNWTVEVNLPKDKAYFTTHTTWHNSSSLDQPYYQWMNAGYKAAGNLQFCYPGNHYIGHDGESHSFPVDEQGRDISWYKNNDFESSKSYHVNGYYNDFYGAYWHDDDFGSVHYARPDDKLGMKIFLWSQASDGKIWEDLLTDTDGQYVELQSGRMYNQPATNSAFTPFKHSSFAPQGTDEWTEYWYPVKGTQGIAKASRIGALNYSREGDKLTLRFSPVENGEKELNVYVGDKVAASRKMKLEALKPWTETVSLDGVSDSDKLKIVIGNDELVYSEDAKDHETTRPQTLPDDFDWNSAYGLYVKGEQWMNTKLYDRAEKDLRACLEKEPYFAPALVRLSSLMNHLGRYDEAAELSRKALSLNTYDGEANYNFAYACRKLGNITDAKDAFSVASYNALFRSAACEQLAAIFMTEKDFAQAETYAKKSLRYNPENIDAKQDLITIYRLTDKNEAGKKLIDETLSEFPLNHFVRFEKYRLEKGSPSEFRKLIRCELPDETYIELALWYIDKGCLDEAAELLSFAEGYPTADYLRAYTLHKSSDEKPARELVNKTNAASPRMVFPFRPETMCALDWVETVAPSWKISYYKALIYYANKNKDKALELLNKCDDADFAPLFLTRAMLKNGDARLADLQKAEKLERNWRTGDALVNYYIAEKNWTEANKVASKYYRLYPDNYVIGLKYGRTLCETGNYAASISLLKKIKVLPNEGAYAGRGVYRDANLYQAIDYIKAKKYAKAEKAVEDSKIWIENLGVGKPYEDQIDYRLENYLSALAMADASKSNALLQTVADYTVNENRTFNSNDLLTSMALRKSGKQAEADGIVERWAKQFPDNIVAKWCIAIYNGDTQLANRLLQSRESASESTPWENVAIDRNFELITKMADLLK